MATTDERPSISEVWELAGGQVFGNGSGWCKAGCFLHADRTPSASVNEDLGKWKCFSCGEYGDVFDIIAKWQGLNTFKEVKDYVASLGIECHATSGPRGGDSGLRKSAHSASGGLSRKPRTAGGRTFTPSWRRW